MKYTSFDELNGKTLKGGDRVIIAGIEHIVYYRFLNCNGQPTNRPAFTDLGIDADKACTELYGYPAEDGSWPVSTSCDYEALTRAVLFLFAMHEGFDVEIQMPNGRWKLFRQEDWKDQIEVEFKVTDGYLGVFTPEGLQVGCQLIGFDKIEEVYKRMKEYQKKLKK